MEWLAILLFGGILVAIAFNALKHVLDVAERVYNWVFSPKEWWSGFLVHGTFRPRLSTLLPVAFVPLVLCALALLLFALSLEFSSNWLGMGSVAILFVTGLVTKKVWRLLRAREHVRVQRERDRRALVLRDAISSGAAAQNYSLYLRPFTVTGEVPICVLNSTMQGTSPKGKPLPPTYDRSFLDLETLMAMALDSYAPLICLGLPGEQVGAGRIQTADVNWRQEFLRLASAARLILLIPSSRRGTAWELKTVLNSGTLLSKTVFIIPPVAGNDTVYRSALNSFRDAAGGDVQGLATDGQVRIDLPKSGLAFRWDKVACRLTFSAPLIHYVQPSPVRFVLDLWLSRETSVVSGRRLKGTLLDAAHANA